MLLIKRLYPVVVILFWLAGQMNAQTIELGSPLIENFSPREYGYESQNYSITQDERGVLFIGNLNGILEFDGVTWSLIEINGVPRLVNGFDHRIYCGGYDDFGYLGHDEKYSTEYVSILHSEQGKGGYIGYVLELISLKNEVLFYTADKIFRWDGNEVSIIDSSETEFSVFQVEDKVFIHKMGIGIMNYVHNGFDTLPNTEYFKNVGIREIMPYTDGSLLIKPDKVEGFMIYDYLSLRPFRTETDLFLKLNKLTCGKKIGAGMYALGTERCGLVIIDEKGKIVCSVNRETGLIDDEVADIYIDYDGCMWVALSNGFARIEFPAAFSYFGRNTGIKGGVSSILRHNGKIYAATTQGVYYLTDESPANHQNDCFNYEKFKLVTGIEVECNTLISLNGDLIVTANEGVFEIKNLKGTMISEGLLETIVISSRDSSVIYFAKDDGLSIAKFINGRYDELGSLEKLDKHVRTIAEDDNGILWLGTDYHGVFMTDMSKGPDLTADVFQFRNNYGLPVDHGWIDVYKTSSGVLFSTQKGVFRYNYDSLRFYQDTLLGLDFSSGEVWMYP
ncbi:MAG: two-component regulator propeller domain-containing protein, partial [Bacteroidota bacterium]